MRRRSPLERSGLCLAALLAFSFPAWAEGGDAARGAATFKACSNCHVVQGDRTVFGPSLQGVVGRKAGSVPGYRYSEAMLAAGEQGLIWTEADLSAFLSSPKRKVPGTSMRFWGFWSQSSIDDVIAYLKANP
ncbi:cytochrome c family protein [Rhizobium sp. CC-YZS058]|uniref:c-type cytochrome n=1 Tax=Rhizobium sp. CC-YZS058 TaxID=3042153 RepID=UPI002B05222A|nr:cytochrome c family protein [Rhizobium sp. CC-YZS058]MEA3534323.1 cytochrome c family protein [Rhizobium sp. CC-YZS058]